MVETAGMTALPLALQLLEGGIPPTLLIDLLDPEGMKLALASELTASDVQRAPAPAVARRVRSA
jgi:hypothetical protein